MKEVQRRLTGVKKRCSNNIDSGKCKQTKYLLTKAAKSRYKPQTSFWVSTLTAFKKLIDWRAFFIQSNDDIWEITIIWPLQTVQ